MLFSSSLDKSVYCWSADYGDIVRKYENHDHMVSDINVYQSIC